MTGAFCKLSTEINDDFRKLPIYRCCKKRIAVRIVFSQNRNIPIYRLYRPPLFNTVRLKMTVQNHQDIPGKFVSSKVNTGFGTL